MKPYFSILLIHVVAAAASAITIQTVPVGDPDNLTDTRISTLDFPNGVGAVAYSFNIGKTEVTNVQYVAFLNAVAKSDPYGLYGTQMSTDTRGGIVRNGISGNFVYAVKPAALGGTYAYDNKPVVDVDWGDVVRFANWMHNGQPMGNEGTNTTEDGAYTLNGTTNAIALGAITRNSGARWWIPSNDEWHKAAYYNPVNQSYYNYPTSSNSTPNNNLPISDTGNSANYSPTIATPTTGNANFPLTDAGAYSLSASPYGTYDQAGNVIEWTDTHLRILGGFATVGMWTEDSSKLYATDYFHTLSDTVVGDLGFRVASIAIPEPSTMTLAAMFAVSCTARRRRTTVHNRI